MEITSYSIFNLFTGIILIFVSLAIFCLGKKSLSAKLFAYLSFITGVWSCLIAVAVSLSSLYSMQLITECNHFLGTVIASIFLLFSISYPYDTKINKKIIVVLVAIEILFAYLLFFTNTIILGTFTLPHLKYLGWTYGSLGFLFNFYFIISWLIGIVVLFKKLRSSKDFMIHRNLQLMLLALIIGITPPAIITILLPQIGVFDYYWLSPISGLFWLLLIAYSITRHHLFNIHIIAIQLITFIFWIILFIRMILAETKQEIFIESILLIIAVIFGVTLIRSVLHEKVQREKIEKLEEKLKQVLVG